MAPNSSEGQFDHGGVLLKAWLPDQIVRGHLGSLGCTGRVLFNSLNLPREVWFPARGFYIKHRSHPWGEDLCGGRFDVEWLVNYALIYLGKLSLNLLVATRKIALDLPRQIKGYFTSRN